MLTLKNGARLSFGEAGSGPPLILVHGSPGSGRAWARVMKHLPSDMQVLTPDLPGYGRSDPLLPDTAPRTEAMAAAIVELIDRCGTPVWLAGHSYGGNVALHAALHRPKCISGLLLLEPVFMHALDLTGRRAARVDAQAFFTPYLVRVELGEPDAIALMIDFWSGAGAYARIPAKQQYFLNESAAKNADDVRASFSETITAAQLKAFDRPVVITFGGASPPLAASIADALAELLPNVHLRSIPGATHAMLDTHPHDVVAAIGHFCRGPVPVS